VASATNSSTNIAVNFGKEISFYERNSAMNRTYAEIDSALTPSPSPAGEGRKN